MLYIFTSITTRHHNVNITIDLAICVLCPVSRPLPCSPNSVKRVLYFRQL